LAETFHHLATGVEAVQETFHLSISFWRQAAEVAGEVEEQETSLRICLQMNQHQLGFRSHPGYSHHLLLSLTAVVAQHWAVLCHMKKSPRVHDPVFVLRLLLLMLIAHLHAPYFLLLVCPATVHVHDR